jgi:predicted Zn-dependent protease
VGVSYPKLLSLCPSLNPILKDTIDEVAEHMNLNGYPVIIQDKNNTGTVCNQHRGHYGYTTLDNNRTNIYINNKLLYLPNTLYNVLLHEVLHSIGLDHSDKEGMMKYAITENWYGSPVNDERKLWLSIDDLQGLYDIKYIQGAVNS